MYIPYVHCTTLLPFIPPPPPSSPLRLPPRLCCPYTQAKRANPQAAARTPFARGLVLSCASPEARCSLQTETQRWPAPGVAETPPHIITPQSATSPRCMMPRPPPPSTKHPSIASAPQPQNTLGLLSGLPVSPLPAPLLFSTTPHLLETETNKRALCLVDSVVAVQKRANNGRPWGLGKQTGGAHSMNTARAGI